MYNLENERDDSGELYTERPPTGECEGYGFGLYGPCLGVGERMFEPYQWDIGDSRVWVYYCENCSYESSMDI